MANISVDKNPCPCEGVGNIDRAKGAIMDEQIPQECNMMLGLSLTELTKVRRKLDVLGLDLSDLIEFLDRDKVQLFYELKAEIRQLKYKLEKIAGVVEEINE